MKKQIENRDDLVFLMNKFYEKAMNDEKIGFFFTEVAPLNLEKHIPLITNFWEDIIFGTYHYKNNPMLVHQELHKKHAISDIHFKQWIFLFTKTVDEFFIGNHAEKIKQRATSIATVMNIKINHPNKNNLL